MFPKRDLTLHKTVGSSSSTPVRVAVIHEWLTSYAGSEKVVEQILHLFPDADLFSLVDFLPPAEREFLHGKQVHTSYLQNLPKGSQLFRKLLWLLPSAIESFDLSAYDIVISSSHAVAKGVITGPDQLHICYCHSPIRYAWDLQHEYLRQAKLTRGLKGLYSRAILHYMRLWDLRTANGVDFFVANSRFIEKRIAKVYRRRSAVIHPPVDVDAFDLVEGKEDYYITVSRLVPYKRVDLIVDAFMHLPNRRLIVIGDGPQLADCKQRAGSNVEFLGYQSPSAMHGWLSRAKAFLFAAEEDFGISVVEAQACGTPVICYGRGGALDSVIHGKTGVFFNEQTAESISAAVDDFESISDTLDPAFIRAHSEQFGIQRFRDQFYDLVLSRWTESASRNQPFPALTRPTVTAVAAR